MKGTDLFKTTIKRYIDNLALSDPEFKKKVQNPKKNFDDCTTYILNEVQKSGCNGFADDEIFGMAVHYFDEENIEIGNKINANVVINQTHKAEPKETAKLEPKKEEVKVMVDKTGQVTLF